MSSKKKKGGKSMPAFKFKKSILEEAQKDVDELKITYTQQEEDIIEDSDFDVQREYVDSSQKIHKPVFRKLKTQTHNRRLNIIMKPIVALDKTHLFIPLGYKEYYPLHKIQDVVSQLKKDTDTHLLFSGVQQMTDAVFAVLLKLKDDRYNSVTNINLAGCHHITDRGVLWLTLCFENLNTLNLTGCVKVTESSLNAVATNCKSMTNLTLAGTSVSFLPAWLGGYTNVDASYLPLASPPLERYEAEKQAILKDGNFFKKTDSSLYKVVILRRKAIRSSLLKLVKKENDVSVKEQVTSDLNYKYNQNGMAFIECPESVVHLFSSKRTCFILPYELQDKTKLKQEAANIAGFICELTAQAWPSQSTYTLVGMNSSAVGVVPPDVLKDEVVNILKQITNDLNTKLNDLTDPK
ncbi:uncharacterized protein LOC121389671 [Gigantopelta aegis]|uniref:uncharacterized protein LOC121389671 n=1 Tax=Gigantopelta aegis TaxID=1735272 RepID=UPI001B88C8CE|nr:uncharacterized protein LOC121389671 [Gigantopelta aegis]